MDIDHEAALWDEAVAYMRDHGDQWTKHAMAHMHELIRRGDLLGSEKWVKILDMMVRLAEAQRQ